MTTETALRKLGGFLFWLAVAVIVGTVAELAMAKHWDEPVQLVPFAVCGAALAALAAVRLRPGTASLRAFWVVMTVVAATSLFGAWEHVQANRGFMLERNPDLSGASLLLAMVTGRAPVGAPGVLALGAVLALASQWALTVAAARTTVVERRWSLAPTAARREPSAG